MMKKLLAIAALLLASTAAQAQYTFEYGGRTIRVDPDRGTVSIPGVYDNSGRRVKRSRNEDGDRPRKQGPQQAKTDPQAPPPAEAAAPPPPAATEQTPAPAPAVAAPAPVPPVAPEPTTTTAAVAPADTAVTPPSPLPPAASAPAPQPQVQQEPAPAPKPAPAPAVAAVTPPPAAPQAANSPLGVWLTEEKEGKVRIEQCGANLCGYSVDKKSNQNGEQVLINMKPGKDKWSGRILDPNTGSTYDSTIALKGTDTLRVQGCAFGGVFCGGL
jgi:uncharacterized protein (DUF2147 family)